MWPQENQRAGASMFVWHTSWRPETFTVLQKKKKCFCGARAGDLEHSQFCNLRATKYVLGHSALAGILKTQSLVSICHGQARKNIVNLTPWHLQSLRRVFRTATLPACIKQLGHAKEYWSSSSSSPIITITWLLCKLARDLGELPSSLVSRNWRDTCQLWISSPPYHHHHMTPPALQSKHYHCILPIAKLFADADRISAHTRNAEERRWSSSLWWLSSKLSSPPESLLGCNSWWWCEWRQPRWLL